MNGQHRASPLQKDPQDLPLRRGQTHRAEIWVGVLLLLAATLATFRRACGHDFVHWDDDKLIVGNRDLNPPTAKSVLRFWQRPQDHLYIPVLYMLWAGLADVAQLNAPDEEGVRLNPWVFHTANLTVHLVNALLVLIILRKLSQRPWAAWAGAMVFAIHPLQAEAVAWATGMKDLLGGMLSLAALQQYLAYASGERQDDAPDKPAHGAVGARAHYAAATGLYLLALLAKPSAMVVPAMAGAIDWGILRGQWRRIVKVLAPWGLAAVACMVWTKLAQPMEASAVVPAWWARPFVAVDAIVFYLGKLMWPTNLGIDYGRIPSVVLQHRSTYLLWLIPTAIGLIIWRWRSQRRWLLTSAAVFLAGVLPVLGFVPFFFQYYSTVADRYVYLSMLGVAMAVTWAAAGSGAYLRTRRTAMLWRPAGSWRWSVAPVALTIAWGIVLARLALGAFIQTGYWENTPTLMEHALRVNPGSFAAHNNLARWLGQQGKLNESADHLVLALACVDAVPPGTRPNAAPAFRNVALALMRLGRQTEAIRLMERAVQLQADDPELRHDLELVRQGSIPPLPASSDPTTGTDERQQTTASRRTSNIEH